MSDDYMLPLGLALLALGMALCALIIGHDGGKTLIFYCAPPAYQCVLRK